MSFELFCCNCVKMCRLGGDVFLVSSCMIFTSGRRGCTVLRRMAAHQSCVHRVQATARALEA